MTELQAKQVLLRYRPGSPDAAEPDIVEALAQVGQSAESQAWLDSHSAMQQAIRAQFKRIKAPVGLKEQILSERKAHTSGFWPKTPAALATALAALTVIGLLAGYWLKPYLSHPDDGSLTFYRTEMVGRALRAYNMDLETHNLTAVRSFLAGRQVDAAWTLPAGMEKTTVTGCGVLGWQDKKVAMICFHSGKPMAPGQKTDVFLFVVDRTAVHNPPAAGKPVLARVNELTTASWSDGDRTYVLAVEGDESLLKSFL